MLSAGLARYDQMVFRPGIRQMKAAHLLVGVFMLVVSAFFVVAGAAPPKSQAAAPTGATTANAEYDLGALAEQKIIDTPEYWLAHAVAGEKCDGERVATMLVRAAKMYRPSPAPASTQEAIDVLLQHGV